MSNIVFRLMRRHQMIDGALRREQARRLPDFARLRQLKKMKLAVKDRLALLMTGKDAARQS